MFDIDDCPIFAGLKRSEHGDVFRLCTGLRLQPGTRLARQGSPGRDCVLVCRGEVDVERDGAVVTRLGSGALFGEMALLSDFPTERTASGRTATECDVLVFSAREFSQLLDRFPSVGVAVRELAQSRAAAS